MKEGLMGNGCPFYEFIPLEKLECFRYRKAG
jgi:hypothetical protein